MIVRRRLFFLFASLTSSYFYLATLLTASRKMCFRNEVQVRSPHAQEPRPGYVLRNHSSHQPAHGICSSSGDSRVLCCAKLKIYVEEQAAKPIDDIHLSGNLHSAIPISKYFLHVQTRFLIGNQTRRCLPFSCWQTNYLDVDK